MRTWWKNYIGRSAAGIFITMTVLIGISGCTVPVKSILWEEDNSGFIQFYTNDSIYYNTYFYVWYENLYQPVMEVVETKVKKVSGFSWGGYGIIFCLQDKYNFYLLLIDTHGYYTVYEMNEGSWIEKIRWAYSSNLKQGFGKINSLKVAHNNNSSNFSISFNGLYTGSFYDSSFSGGYSGYFVEVWGNDEENFPDTPEDVRFRQVVSSYGEPPVADAGPDRSIVVDGVVLFDGSGSTDPDGNIVSYSWDFGDGYTGSGVTASHSYSVEGTYEVKLTVTDDAGLSDRDTITVTVLPPNEPPTADAGPDRTAYPGDVINFNGSGSNDTDGTIDTYFWDFGDGYTGSDEKTTHTYTSEGSYDVTLTVTDDDGAFDTDGLTVTVYPYSEFPVADAGQDRDVYVYRDVYFDGSGSYPDASIEIYSWDFGDGITETGSSVRHRYNSTGNYTVTLTVYDREGDSDSDSVTVTVIDMIEGLAAEYLFNEDANDTSGNGYDGTVYGATLSEDRFGNPYGAYYFDGVDDYIEIPFKIDSHTEEFSIHAFVLMDNSIGYDGTVIRLGKDGGEIKISGPTQTYDRLGFGVKLAVGWREVRQQDDAESGRWHSFTGVYRRGDRLLLFVDGVLDSELEIEDYDIFIYSPLGSTIGCTKYYSYTERHWKGKIDDLRFFTRALTADEIRSLYEEGGWSGN
jgi:PKD repeat protein